MGMDGIDETLHGVSARPTAELESPSAAPTTQLTVDQRRGSRRRGASQLGLTFVAVAAASFLVGIAVASATRPQTAGAELVSQDVGPSGGTVRFDGGEIRIPGGALNAVAHVVVRRTVVDRRVTIDAGGGKPLVFEPGRLVAYRFAPTDVTFRKAVVITFRLPAGARNGTAFALRAAGDVVLLHGTVNADRGTAAVRVHDFRFGGGT